MRLCRTFLCVLTVLGIAHGQHVGAPTTDLDKVSAEELFSIQVTSVGRKAQRLSKSAAAVFVLTAEDIRRSGATCIPEALQFVPGLTVLHVNQRDWVVSARGGARQYANKMLVMIDGRSLYTPLFSGVIWDVINVPLEDIAQIEVVRGPASVMWGPNAVNGVINIITKSAKATKNGEINIATGNEVRNATTARWGGTITSNIAYRAWGKFDYLTPGFSAPIYSDHAVAPGPAGRNLDAGTLGGGFRIEGKAGAKGEWMLEGDKYDMDRQEPLLYSQGPNNPQLVHGHTDWDGSSIQGRWTQNPGAGNESVTQFSYSSYDFNYPYMSGAVSNLTVDFQKRRQTGEHNELYWGAGFQQYSDNMDSRPGLGFSPSQSKFRSGDAVLRDEWQMVPGKWLMSAGIRLDYSSYTHLEYQPSFRLLYTPNASQSAWISISRAVRLPSRVDRDIRASNSAGSANGIPIQVDTFGDPSIHSETERGLEAGYRLQSGQHWSVDVSAFWSYYGKLSALGIAAAPQLIFPGGAPLLEIRSAYGNFASGRTYGGEIWATWQLRPGWRLIPSYSYLNESQWLLPATAQTSYRWGETGPSIPHQGIIRSQHDLAKNVKLDLMARARSRDEASKLPAALLLDARISWRPIRSSEISFTAQNLTDRRILETYLENLTPQIPLRRAFVIKWTQRF